MASPPTDYDSPWKEALEQYFPEFLALCAPALHAAVNWAHPPQFLDKELQALTRDVEAKRRYADKLVRVQGSDSQPALIFVHIEVQGGATGPAMLVGFSARMFQYFYRISDRYLPGGRDNAPANHANTALFSPGVLTLTQSMDEPPFLEYRRNHLGCRVQFRFPVVHLAQWNARWSELEHLGATNPFAVVIMAQLQAQANHDAHIRLASKTALTRLLYQFNYSRKDVLRLFRLIDWIITLPPELDDAYTHEVDLIEQEQKMAYVTSIERRGIRQGMQAGQLKGSVAVLHTQIERKFGPVPEWAQERIDAADAATLQQWALNILDARTIEKVFDTQPASETQDRSRA
jgi:hypothetical protein